MRRLHTGVVVVALTSLSAAACSDSSTAPVVAAGRALGPNLSAVKFWDANAAADWNEHATSLAARRTVGAVRLYTYLSLAQLRAAEDAEGIRPHPPISAAIAGASAAVLRAFSRRTSPKSRPRSTPRKLRTPGQAPSIRILWRVKQSAALPPRESSHTRRPILSD